MTVTQNTANRALFKMFQEISFKRSGRKLALATLFCYTNLLIDTNEYQMNVKNVKSGPDINETTKATPGQRKLTVLKGVLQCVPFLFCKAQLNKKRSSHRSCSIKKVFSKIM